ncbi:MAG: DUF1800 domain-containing protein [Phycisphaerae bacterium]|nr:DUF1800 domain-containing protein [Phycisphaerae bacterium]NUQ46316.1 DUF1800 domain-containing protein [Phycisphaerae bacterium]
MSLITLLLAMLFGTGVPPADPAVEKNASSAASAEWNEERAAHLLRRAGFGGTPEQVKYLASLGRDRAVEYLVDYESIPFEMPEPKIAAAPVVRPRIGRADLDEEERRQLLVRFRMLSQLAFREISGWWIERMIATPRPLEEKMVLFWHGHFTSGFREVNAARPLYGQNQLFRRMAVGNFCDLTLEISRDTAMLLYLNNAQNRKQKPNENFARELLELFTLGAGHYTEQDIKEAARAFTGWTINPQDGGFFFAARQHDFGAKTFMGRSGNFDGEEIIAIIFQQPAASQHLVRKLWTYFAGTEIPSAELERLSRLFRAEDYELRPLLKAMFHSEGFYAADVMHQQVKCPVDLVVGTIRMLEVVPEDTLALTSALRMMGQELFQPPNVKGWDGGLTWINTASLFNRYNLLAYVVYGTPQRPKELTRRLADAEQMMNQMQEIDPQLAAMGDYMMDPAELLRHQPPFDPAPLLRRHKLERPEKIVDHFVQRLLQRKISPSRRKVLIDELKRVGGKLEPGTPETIEAVRGVIHLILSMPDYQLG